MRTAGSAGSKAGWYDKAELAVGFPIAIGGGALFGYFLGKQKVTKNKYKHTIIGNPFDSLNAGCWKKNADMRNETD